MKSAHSLVLSALAALLPAISAPAAMLTINPVADATIYGEREDFANGRGTGIIAGNNANSVSATRRGLIRFDLSVIPPDSVIASVTLRMTVTQENTGLPSLPFTLTPLTRAWTEGPAAPSGFGGGGAPSAAGDTTWLSASLPGNAWAAHGGDFAAEPSATTPIGPEGNSYAWSSTAMAADVQNWYSLPSTNFGWILRSDESITRSAKVFGSREATNPAQRPALEITYFAVVPEPAQLLMLPVGMALLIRRHRQHA